MPDHPVRFDMVFFIFIQYSCSIINYKGKYLMDVNLYHHFEHNADEVLKHFFNIEKIEEQDLLDANNSFFDSLNPFFVIFKSLQGTCFWLLRLCTCEEGMPVGAAGPPSTSSPAVAKLFGASTGWDLEDE